MHLRLENISKTYRQALFNDLNLSLADGDKLGIVGRNGQGKTTLLKIILGELNPDNGKIIREPTWLRVSYHAQFLPPTLQRQTVEEYIVTSSPELHSLYKELQDLLARPDLSTSRLLEVQTQFTAHGGYDLIAKIPELLAQLHLNDVDANSLISQLSGGQKTRLQLVKLLVDEYEVLILDEPTNHLDQDAILWLIDFVQTFNGIVIVVSHDRQFLDSTVNQILEIEDSKAILYPGNYADFQQQKQSQQLKQQQLYQLGMKKVRKLKAVAEHKAAEANTTHERVRSGFEAPYIRKMAGKKSKTAKILRERIEKEIIANLPDAPAQHDDILLDFQPRQASGGLILRLEDWSCSYQDKLIFQHVNLEIRRGEKVLIAGTNGSGKTTLLKSLSEHLPDEYKMTGKIAWGTQVDMGFFSQEHEDLDLQLSVLDNFRKDINISVADARTFLYYLLFSGEQVFQQVASLSQGEKSKLVLAKLLYRRHNFLVLDEPTNHLDINSREVIEKSLRSYTGSILAVSHDQYFADQVGFVKKYNLQTGQLKLAFG